MEEAHIHYQENGVDVDVERIFVGQKARNQVLAELLMQQTGKNSGAKQHGFAG